MNRRLHSEVKALKKVYGNTTVLLLVKTSRLDQLITPSVITEITHEVCIMQHHDYNYHIWPFLFFFNYVPAFYLALVARIR